jgi:hypothetical protein
MQMRGRLRAVIECAGTCIDTSSSICAVLRVVAAARPTARLFQMFRLFITERKGNIHWNVPSRVEASKAALKQLPACHATRGKTEEPYDPQRTTT